MTRVLHVISTIDPTAGGPTAAFTGLVTAQAAAGLSVAAIATYRDGADTSPREAIARAGVDLRLVGPARPPLDTHPDLAAAIDAGVADADVVHVHTLWEQAQHLAARSATRQGKPFVIRPAGMLTHWSLAHSRWKKWAYLRWRMAGHLRRATAVHFTTELERRQSAGVRLGSPPIVEPNGVDLAEFEHLPPRGSFRAKHPAIGGRPVVAFLGRIFPGKGVEHLVPAIADLAGRGLDPVLLVIGPDGDRAFRAEVDAAIAARGIGGRVVFAGMLKGREKVAALADADLFCLPSHHENFGIAAVEALAAGLPAIVSTDVGVHADITAAGAGSAVPRDPGRIADELAAWLGDEPRRRAAGARARAFVRERYDWHQIARRWAGHYERLAKG